MYKLYHNGELIFSTSKPQLNPLAMELESGLYEYFKDDELLIKFNVKENTHIYIKGNILSMYLENGYYETE